MLNRRVATQSFAQHQGTGATPAAGAKAGATQGTFTTIDAIPWKPVDPKDLDWRCSWFGGIQTRAPR
jgi:hypothetical protein